MTDKVQKIREEVERLKGWNNNVRNSTRHMTLQEEDFNRGKHSSYLEILSFIDSLQEEPLSEDLERAADKEASDMWDKMEGEYDIAHDNFIAGAQWQKNKIMENAIEAIVAVDAGGYPYVDKHIELYDYDKDVPLAKEGDKVKIVVIRSEES